LGFDHCVVHVNFHFSVRIHKTKTTQRMIIDTERVDLRQNTGLLSRESLLDRGRVPDKCGGAEQR